MVSNISYMKLDGFIGQRFEFQGVDIPKRTH
jgi:hypothetical protein